MPSSDSSFRSAISFSSVTQVVALRYILYSHHNLQFSNDVRRKDLSVLRVTGTESEALSLEQLDVVFGESSCSELPIFLAC